MWQNLSKFIENIESCRAAQNIKNGLNNTWNTTLKIKKICLSLKVSIQLFLEPFEKNLGKKAQSKGFSTKSALAN